MKGNANSNRFKALIGGLIVILASTFAQTSIAGYLEEVLADKPVAYWRLDESSGTTAVDLTGNNDGTIIGGIASVSGVVGNAFRFDGLSGRVNMGNPESLNFGTAGEFSLEAWFNWDGGGSFVNNIIRKSDYPVSPLERDIGSE